MFPKGAESKAPAVLPRYAEVLRSELPKAKLDKPWAISAAVARFLHTEEVTGSNPVSPTNTFSFLALLRRAIPNRFNM